MYMYVKYKLEVMNKDEKGIYISPFIYISCMLVAARIHLLNFSIIRI